MTDPRLPVIGPDPSAPAAPAPVAPELHPRSVAPRPGPDMGAVFVAEYRLLVRAIATKGRLAAVGALALVGLLMALAVSASSPSNPIRSAVGYVDGYLSTLTPVAVLVFGAATLGDLVDDATLVYLWLRPVPARIHVLAAWAATVTITLPLVTAPMLLGAAIIHSGDGVWLAAILGALVATLTYAAMFVLAGIRFKRALPWGLVYILIWEGFVATAGETASKLAIRSYVRSVLAQVTDQRLKLGDRSLVASFVVPALVTAASLAYASRRLAKTDVA